jgi:plasmid stabilization system protein ParE
MRVVLTEAALSDLIDIGRYIRKDNPARAESFVAELRRACQRIGQRPRAYPRVQAREHVELRRRRHGAYLIFYRVTDRVEIIHVLHGARDYATILSRDE